jgi:hypothetical protein
MNMGGNSLMMHQVIDAHATDHHDVESQDRDEGDYQSRHGNPPDDSSPEELKRHEGREENDNADHR